MSRTCNQLGYCKQAEIDPCLGECKYTYQPDQEDVPEISKFEHALGVISWLVIGLTSIAMVGVIASAIYGFGYDFLNRIG